VTAEAPPARPEALGGAGNALGVAAVGGAVSFGALAALCQVLALVQYLWLGGLGLWSWAKIGLLTASLSLRADVIATVQGVGPPESPTAARSAIITLRVVPMILTIGFLWLAARAGRRATLAMPGRSSLITALWAAAGAAVPVAILGGICASLVTLSFPSIGLDLRVDVWSAVVWAGVLAATGAGTGAYLEAACGRAGTAVLRGGLIAYAWALALLAVGVFGLATLEPTVTRAYVDAVLGAPGGALLGLHLLAFPAQSALLLAPASGSCVEIIGEGPMLELCPWRLVPSGPTGRAFLPTPLSLSPWFWLLSGVPLIAATLGGRRAVAGRTIGGSFALGLGIAAGSAFAAFAVLGTWFAAPLLSPLVLPLEISVHPLWLRTGMATLIWGVVGGALGAWLAARRYEEPELPRPTSA
jgi:hypothetical protein